MSPAPIPLAAWLQAVSGVGRGCSSLKVGLIVLWRQGRGLGFGDLTVFRGLAVLSSTNHLCHLPGVRVARLVCHPFPQNSPPFSHLAPALCTVLSGRAPAWLLTRGTCTVGFLCSSLFQPQWGDPCDGGFCSLSPLAAGTKGGLGPQLIPPGNLRPDMVCSFKNSCCKDFKDVVTATLFGQMEQFICFRLWRFNWAPREGLKLN